MPRSKEFSKEEVLAKAKQLFWKQGFHATSIQNLVDHLGINRASIYATFGGKNALYEAALQSYREDNLVYLKSCLSKFDSAKKSLRALFRKSIGMTVHDEDRKGCFIVNCTTEYLPKHDHILFELVDNKSTFQNLVSEALQRGKDSGELSDELIIKDIAAYFYTFLNGLQITAKVNPNKSELFKSIDLALKILD